MRKLIYILLIVLPNVLFAQKRDFIRTPNSNNIIVDWNLKSYTFNAPHGTTPSLRGAPDSTGYIFVQDSIGVKRLRFYAGGVWQSVANNYIGLQDSLTKKANRDFSNVANSTIAYSKLVPLANLTATDATLTFSGAYNGSTARTVGLNLATPNTFTGTQTYSATTPVIYNGAASTAYTNLFRQNGVTRMGVGLTAAGNMVTFYYPDGVTATSAYTTNFSTGVTTYQVAPAVPTQSANDNSTKAASTAYVDAAITNSVLQIVEITGTSQTAQAGRLYIPHNAALTTITLPATANIGALIQVVGEGAGKWQIQHGNATDVIVGISGFTTVAGTTHGIIASDQNGTISLRKTNTNKWTFTTLNGTVSAY